MTIRRTKSRSRNGKGLCLGCNEWAATLGGTYCSHCRVVLPSLEAAMTAAEKHSASDPNP